MTGAFPLTRVPEGMVPLGGVTTEGAMYELSIIPGLTA